MDFVDWCGKVLDAVIEASRATADNRTTGVGEQKIADYLFGENSWAEPTFHNSIQREAMFDAILELEKTGLIKDRGHRFYLPSSAGLEASKDPKPVWQQICSVELEKEHEQLLRAVNRLSQHTSDTYSWVREVTNEPILAELHWDAVKNLLWAVSEELAGMGLIRRRAYSGGKVELIASYGGLVWESRRGHMRKCDVFISHASDETAAAVALKDCLLKAFGEDLKVFVSSDYHSITGGKVWFPELIEALKSAPVTLLLLSQSSVGRRWLNFEAGAGIGAGNLVIPLVVTGFSKGDVGHPLAELQARALSDPKDVGGMLRDISTHLDMPFESTDAEAFAAADSAAGGAKLEASINHVPERAYEGYQEHKFIVGLTNNSTKAISDHRVEAEIPNAVLNQSTGYGDEIENRRTAEYRYFRAYGKDRRPQVLHPGDRIPQFFTPTLVIPPGAEESGTLEKKIVVTVFAGDVRTQRIEKTVREILEQAPSFG